LLLPDKATVSEGGGIRPVLTQKMCGCKIGTNPLQGSAMGSTPCSSMGEAEEANPKEKISDE